jgi:proteasome lid subunit RPN8/RPN11
VFPPVDPAVLTAPVDRELLAALTDRGLLTPMLPTCPLPSPDPPDPDEVVTPPEPYDGRPALRITHTAYRGLLRYLGSRPPEAAGALLGPRGGDLITRFVPDRWGHPTPASFTFGAAELNRAVRPFVRRGEEVLGLAHSHPGGCPAPSPGDRAYLARVFGNPRHAGLTAFLFPIVEGGRLRPYVALRDGPGGAVRIEDARLEVVADPRPPRTRAAPGPLDTARIAPLLDVGRMAASTVTFVGVGGGANHARNLARCGLGRLNLVDFDTVEAVNVCRQEHPADMVGRLKVDALARELRRINPRLRVRRHPRDFCTLTDAEVDRHFGDTDLFVFAVDNLAANARGNEVALRLGKPAVWGGLYAGGRAGEVAFWTPGLPCYRCLCAARYAARDRGEDVGQPAESADILAVQHLDSVAGMVALGLLTAGADNGYGRLIAQLGGRNFLQMKLSPEWAWRGRDVVREQLGVAADCPAYFSWVTIARSDPAGGDPPCPDCARYRRGG